MPLLFSQGSVQKKAGVEAALRPADGRNRGVFFVFCYCLQDICCAEEQPANTSIDVDVRACGGGRGVGMGGHERFLFWQRSRCIILHVAYIFDLFYAPWFSCNFTAGPLVFFLSLFFWVGRKRAHSLFRLCVSRRRKKGRVHAAFFLSPLPPPDVGEQVARISLFGFTRGGGRLTVTGFRWKRFESIYYA